MLEMRLWNLLRKATLHGHDTYVDTAFIRNPNLPLHPPPPPPPPPPPTPQAMEGKGSSASGKPEVVSLLQAQVDQMTGRNQELRQELRLAREEASEALSALAKAQVKVLV